jgi:hypothetical protein
MSKYQTGDIHEFLVHQVYRAVSRLTSLVDFCSEQKYLELVDLADQYSEKARQDGEDEFVYYAMRFVSNFLKHQAELDAAREAAENN